MSEGGIRCPDCGKRISANDPKCPACGYGNVPTTLRIRCNYCSRRIPANSVVCPSCQHNPRAFYWKRTHVIILGLLLLAGALGVFWWFKDDFSANLNVVALLNPTTTPSLTRAPITVIITATPRAATKTAVPPTQTVGASPTPRATDTPTLSPTATATLTPLRGTPRATETFTPVPTPIPIPPPKLVSPTDNEQVRGASKHIFLTFHPAQPIGALEWYRLQVDYLDRLGTPVSWCAFTKESALEFPREFFDDSSPNVRSFVWHVNVVRSNQISPATCDAAYDLLSAPSDVWTFYWY